MNWEELMEEETYSGLWLPLLNLLKLQDKDTFTYRQIADLWDREKGNTYQKISQWGTIAPELVNIDEDASPHAIHFDWEGLPYAEPPEVEEETDFPDFLTRRTVNSITEALKGLDVLGEDHELEFERGHVWHKDTQRGQLITYVTKNGIRLVRALALYDNGFIVSKVNISTAKEKWA